MIDCYSKPSIGLGLASLAAHVVLAVAGILLMQCVVRAVAVLRLATLVVMAVVMVPVLAVLMLMAVMSLAVMHILRSVRIDWGRRRHSTCSTCSTRTAGIGHRRPVLSATLPRPILLQTMCCAPS